MTDITELERRITAALDRIGNGLDAVAAPVAASGDADELAKLQTALEEERTANAQLEERLKALHVQQDATISELQAAVKELRASLDKRSSDVQRLQKVNDQLRSTNQLLRTANESGVGEPHLINKSMMAELDALRLARDTDRGELDAILSELRPLVEGRADA